MKIFNTENGMEKVYVQMNDIMVLTHTDGAIPVSIFEKVFSDIVIVDDSNRWDFVEFTSPHEIEFFSSLDWIVDYKQYRDLTEDEIKEKGKKIADNMNEIAIKYNSMSDDDKKDNQALVQEHDLLDYKIKSIAEILWVNQGHTTMPFPVVPDSDGFVFLGDDECEYELRASLDPNKLLLLRKDGKTLSKNDKIPQGFLQMGMSIALTERKKEFIGNYTTKNYLSEDEKYLVTEFKVKSYDTENKQMPKKEKGIKRLIKNIFKKDKK